MIFKSIMLFLLGLLTLTAGCRDNLPPELAGLADQRSLDRFAALSADSSLLLSLHSDGTLDKLPNLGPDGRELGRFGPTALVEVDRSEVTALAKVEGLTEMVLWGDDQAAGKLDPMLRNALLQGMAEPDWRDVEHAVIGTFDKGTADLKDALTKMGAKPRSVAGGIVTFDATSDVIFDILARDDLRQLSKPDLQRPMQGL